MESKHLNKISTAPQLADRIRKIGDDLLEVSRDLANALDFNPKLADELQEHGIDRGVIRRLERFGRGQIHESLVFSTTPGGIKLITVPLSEQVSVITNGVKVLDDDEIENRNIPVHELSNRQASQVFAGGKIRTLTEQRTWLRKQKRKMAPVQKDVDYKVGRDFVSTTRPGKWSKQLILSWLVEMN